MTYEKTRSSRVMRQPAAGSGRVGLGRVGSGRVGSGWAGPGRVGAGRVGSSGRVMRGPIWASQSKSVDLVKLV